MSVAVGRSEELVDQYRYSPNHNPTQNKHSPNLNPNPN